MGEGGLAFVPRAECPTFQGSLELESEADLEQVFRGAGGAKT